MKKIVNKSINSNSDTKIVNFLGGMLDWKKVIEKLAEKNISSGKDLDGITYFLLSQIINDERLFICLIHLIENSHEFSTEDIEKGVFLKIPEETYIDYLLEQEIINPMAFSN